MDLENAHRRLDNLFETVYEVVEISGVKARALRLLKGPSTSARRMRLSWVATALVVSNEDPSKLPLMCFDNRLIQVAKREGFTVNPSLSRG